MGEVTDLEWQSPPQDGDIPSKRSGHSFSVVGTNAFLFGGCTNQKPAGPNSDLYQLKMGTGNFIWVKLDKGVTGDENAPEPPLGYKQGFPLKRWKHSAVVYQKKFVVIFGGFFNSRNRFNDVWYFDTIALAWENVVPPGAEFTPRGNHGPSATAQKEAPPPRGAHSANIIEDAMYIFGGYGGTGYGRRDYNDMHRLDLATREWKKCAARGTPPAARSGHTACAVKESIYVFGGWNAVTQFNDMFIYDTKEAQWSQCETSFGDPRWNHSACSVEAIPHWKIFVFGGTKGSAAQGTYLNDVGVLDTGSNHFGRPEIIGEPPTPRSDTQMAYDSKGSRLIMFGGWANKWFGDIKTLDVGCVVGPPYAIMGLAPKLGAITGGQEIYLEGIDFVDTPQVVVRFSNAKKGVMDVNGEYVSDTQIKCLTPDFTKYGPGEVDVRVSLKGDSFTTTSQKYQFFSVTDATKCLAFGPALLEGGAANVTTTFMLQANDTAGQKRASGGDEWEVTVQSTGDGSMVNDVEVIDNEDGTYICTFTPGAGEYRVEVLFMGTFQGVAGHVRGSPFTATFEDGVSKERNKMEGPVMMDKLRADLRDLQQFTKATSIGLQAKVDKDDIKMLLNVKQHLFNVTSRKAEIDLAVDSTGVTLDYLAGLGADMKRLQTQLGQYAQLWQDVQKQAPTTKVAIAPLVKVQGAKTKVMLQKYEEEVREYSEEFTKQKFYSFATGPDAAREALKTAEKNHIEKWSTRTHDNEHLAQMFEFPEAMDETNKLMSGVSEQIGAMRDLWDVTTQILDFIDECRNMAWADVDAEALDEEAKRLQKNVKGLKREVRFSNAYKETEKTIKDFLTTCPLILALRHPSMRPRHWQMLMDHTGKKFTPPHEDPSMRLAEVLALRLHEYGSDVEDITDQAQKEAKMEDTLAKLKQTWSSVDFLTEEYTCATGDVVLKLKIGEEEFEALEADQLTVQGMLSSRFVDTFKDDITGWNTKLNAVSNVLEILSEVQRTWSYLEPLFIGSDEVKKELPEDAIRFQKVDTDTKKILKEAGGICNVVQACNAPGLEARIGDLRDSLEVCKKALSSFLADKRTKFPRFYFVSEADLLDILSNGSKPEKIIGHVTKIFLATKTFTLTGGGGNARPTATKWISGVGVETGIFEPPVKLEGKVEVYLQTVYEAYKVSMHANLKRSIVRYPTQSRIQWLLNEVNGEPTDLAQNLLLVSGMEYCKEVEGVFDTIAQGNKNALKDYNQKQIQQLNDLITTTLTNLSKGDRKKVMCMITMDAHGRDIVQKMIREGVESKTEFQWQSQLKQRWVDNDRAIIQICDADFDYAFEYLGNGMRLVITPLTDRIYVTATQALHLSMGCAPAGPAGTGKTESTKDLAAALGTVCYVFNCAPEMDYKSVGNIFKGLAASGAWGCFDEFNRLVPEVLSVCTVQFKAVCDGIKAGNADVTIEGETVALNPNCGAFITMNPGYLGRSELPEGLKALFRPMTVMVPDLVLICENMMMAEGFSEAKSLASKFFGLYSLLGDLLSKQLHYDWGLRAVKSVLVVAGGFKRAEPDLAEEALLMRALRDFNIPKIVQVDEVIFFGLLGDLFPGIDPPRQIDPVLEAAVKDACTQGGLWPDETFQLKTVQLEELLAIRHCVFVMGPPAAGKTEVWRNLARSRSVRNNPTKVIDINPKSVSPSELYGYINMATRDWNDGLLSKIMRELGQEKDESPKWIILDGDLDANWIESMNSVMDDNKMLTLASNERIPLKPHMRMIFEIRDLVYATPATVSRAGVLYVSSDKGTQWQSLVASWVQNRPETDTVKEALQELFANYCHKTMNNIKKTLKPLIPIEEMNMAQALLFMLDGLMTETVCSGANAKEIYKNLEPTFVFCAVWAFGSFFSEKDGIDYRKNFSEWWKSEFKAVKFPSRETVFDYYLDKENKLDLWKNCAEYFYSIDYNSKETPMSTVTVPTPETAAVTHWMDLLVNMAKPVMLVGSAGCGKTQLVKGLLGSLNVETMTYTNINFNYYTSAIALQNILEASLEKKTGTNFAPPGTRKLIYFLDDINLPMVDVYNTQDAIALVRQHIDYGHWFDRVKLTMKNINKTQYVSCMNQTAGSFIINPRLQRHFITFAIGFPGPTSLLTIYQTFLDGHLQHFNDEIKNLSSNLINGALGLHAAVVGKFRKTAANFHYEFNIRHMSNVFQGLLTAQPNEFTDPQKFVCLWLHESARVYGDRLVSYDDLDKYKKEAAAQSKRRFPNYNMAKYFAAENADTLLFCHFCENIMDKVYDKVTSMKGLHEILSDALNQHNEMNAAMNLVLFNDAMEHVCRVARIILNPGGHAMLVGVGGSGKQSLSRLATFICEYTLKRIVISQTYGVNDLKEDLKVMYNLAGMRDEGVTFLFTDSQITNERFLVYLNDLLSSGDIPDLFSAEEVDGIVNGLGNKVKATGKPVTKANCWAFFIERIRKNLHMCLCFSPVGEDFRNRALKFPALVNSTVIDWFQPWPQDALLSVGKQFLAPVDLVNDEIRAGIENFMPHSFGCVQKAAKNFEAAEKRHVHSTPKTYLELLKLYGGLLATKRTESDAAIERLSSGLDKLRSTAQIVSTLEEELKVKLVAAEEKKIAAEAQAEDVAREKAIVDEEAAKADVEAAECEKIATEVTAIQKNCEEDLANAEPLVLQAMAALDTLNKKDLGECKSMAKPPSGVDDVFGACMVLLAGVMPSIVTTKKGKVKDRSWDASKKQMLSNVAGFLNQLLDFKTVVDAFTVPKINWKEVRPYLELEHFTPEIIEKKNKAAAGLVSWVINIVLYYDTIVGVEPKRQALAEANARLEAANTKLSQVQAKVAELQAKLKVLTDAFAEAEADKQAAIDAVEQGQMKLDLAQRLINALASENVRWAENIETMKADKGLLTGDVLLASAFISYIGPFTKQYRDKLLTEEFVPFLQKAAAGQAIPMSETCDALKILTTDAEIAKWNTFGLPSDRVSSENGVLVTYSARWPLMIDPQLQGIAWIRDMLAEKDLVIKRLSHKDIVRKLKTCIADGVPMMIENMGESIDAVLWPVISRQYSMRGSKQLVKIGDDEVTVHKDFQLYLHTKLSNPHYPPEIQAECTLVNFTVTQSGLEDQLLSLVVRKERPDLAEKRAQLIQQSNEFLVKVKELEDEILYKLANAEGDITTNVELIEGLEEAKRISNDIAEKSKIAEVTQAQISTISEKYRSVAARGSLLFFIMNDMYKLHTYYVYSLNAFVVIFLRGIDLVSQKKEKKAVGMLARLRAAAKKVIRAQRFDWNQDLLRASRMPTSMQDMLSNAKEAAELEKKNNMTDEQFRDRCGVLEKSITGVVFNYLRRGLFGRDKLTVATQLLVKMKLMSGELSQDVVTALIMGKSSDDPGSMGSLAEWMPEQLWPKVKGLEEVAAFKSFGDDIMSDSDDWEVWFNDEKPELKAMPGENYKDMNMFQRILALRALRQDRVTGLLTQWVSEELGPEYVNQPAFDMEGTYQESSAATPIFFVLFPGVDPTPAVEGLGAKMAITTSNGKFTNISMGQGQEAVAKGVIDRYSKEGGWIMLQNVHLMTAWLSVLETMLEKCAETAHDDFRAFISAEPPSLSYMKNMPESLLQSCIKVANEAPADLKANLRISWANFDQGTVDACSKPNEFKSCLFTLCFFHAVVLGRRKFGQLGWSRKYSFNTGDLTICASVLSAYISGNPTTPWDDLRYIFGEIMYGGHITDPWDRRTNSTYLRVFLNKGIYEGAELAPGFPSPPMDGTFDACKKYIEEKLPPETPAMFGMHANAEIGYLSSTAGYLFSSMVFLGGGGGGGGSGRSDSVVKSALHSVLDKLPPDLDLITLGEKAEPLLKGESAPYVVVAMQEASRMNVLLSTMRLTLENLAKGLDGALNMSQAMEDLADALSINQVPGRNPFHSCSWEKLAWWSNKNLASWFADLLKRVDQLMEWTSELVTPKSLWLPGVFNPTAYLTAVMQATARKNTLPLDNMTVETHITCMMSPDEVEDYAEDGAFCHGIFIEGAGWPDVKDDDADVQEGLDLYTVGSTPCGGYVKESKLKELLPMMPIVYVKAVVVQPEWEPTSVGYLRHNEKVYECPVYLTTFRGPTYVFLATLRSQHATSKWVLAAVAMIFQDDE